MSTYAERRDKERQHEAIEIIETWDKDRPLCVMKGEHPNKELGVIFAVRKNRVYLGNMFTDRHIPFSSWERKDYSNVIELVNDGWRVD